MVNVWKYYYRNLVEVSLFAAWDPLKQQEDDFVIIQLIAQLNYNCLMECLSWAVETGRTAPVKETDTNVLV